jgi:hypothetical protein
MCGPRHLHMNPHQFIVDMIHIFPTIILCNHVMHDDTSSHDIPKALLVPKSSRPLTIANWACKIPNALFTSFLAAACAL